MSRLGSPWPGIPAWILAPCLTVLGCLSLVACGSDPSQESPTAPEEIRIGVLASFAVGFISDGPDVLQGAELALEHINADGGITLDGVRVPVRLIIEEDLGQPEIAAVKAAKLISVDRVAALMGLPVSNSAVTAAQIAQQHRILALSTTSTHPETTRGKDLIFRMTYTDDFQAKILAELAWGRLGARRAALLVDGGSAYSLSFAQHFTETFEDLGGQVVLEQPFTLDDIAEDRHFERIAGVNPDVLVIPVNTPFVETLVQRLQGRSERYDVLGGDTWDGATFEPVDDRQRLFFANVWSAIAAEGRSQEFVELCQERFGEIPKVSMALSYDALSLLALAIERAGTLESEALRDALLDLGTYPGIAGDLEFVDDSGDPQREAVIVEVLPSSQRRVVHRIGRSESEGSD